jgi:hypothetical protein
MQRLPLKNEQPLHIFSLDFTSFASTALRLLSIALDSSTNEEPSELTISFSGGKSSLDIPKGHSKSTSGTSNFSEIAFL